MINCTTGASRLVDQPGCVLHLLGGPYLTFGGRRWDPPEGSKRLLVFVALRGGRMDRRHVAGTLWPLGDEARSAGNLRSCLWRLRVWGMDLLKVDKFTIALSDDVGVDVRLVSDRATRLIRGVAQQEDLWLDPAWGDALDLLPGWYDDWALMERERVRQRMLHGLEALSRELLQRTRYAEAVEAALAAVAADPLRETAQRMLVEVYLAEGNVVEARRAFSAYRDLFDRELGVQPAEDLCARVRPREVDVASSPPGARRLLNVPS